MFHIFMKNLQKDLNTNSQMTGNHYHVPPLLSATDNNNTKFIGRKVTGDLGMTTKNNRRNV